MYLYGASGHAKVIIDILASQEITPKGLFDDNPNIKEIKNIPVSNAMPKKVKELPLIISIGNNAIRHKIANKYEADYQAAIHSKSIISPHVAIGKGSVVMSGVSINADTTIGKHAIINTSSSVDHDCTIGDYVHISPGATLCGGISVGEGTLVGAGAVVISNVTIGKWVTIEAGTTITGDIPDFAVVSGNPAQIIRYNTPPI